RSQAGARLARARGVCAAATAQDPGGRMTTVARHMAPLLLIAAPLAFFAAFFLAPLATVVLASLTGKEGGITLSHYVRVLADHYHWDVIATTFRIAGLTTLICLLVGYPLAWYLVRVVCWRAWRRICVI